MDEAKLTKWDIRFLALAKHVGNWSKDPGISVGAVIVNNERRVVGMGYNGFPRGVEDSGERYLDRDLKLDLTVHAEVNAILNATASTQGATIYVTGLFTCARCAGLIIQAGIKKVVAMPRDGDVSRWAVSVDRAKMMYQEAGVEYVVAPHMEL